MEQTKFKMECQGCGTTYETSWHTADLAIANGVKGYCTKTKQFEQNSIELRWWERKLTPTSSMTKD